MHIAIIGNGIAGITAARYLRKLSSDCRISVISSESPHFYARTALMYLYMGHLTYDGLKPYEDGFWQKNHINLIFDHIHHIDFTQQCLHGSSGNMIYYDKLLLATGSKSKKLELPGQELKGVQGLYSLQDLQQMQQHTQNITHAVVAGGGLIGIEVAEMLRSKGIGVSMLVRESSYWNSVLPPEESGIVNRHIEAHGVSLLLNTQLQAILPDEQGRVRAVVTSSGQEIACRFVAITIGVTPNIDFLRQTNLETDRGILVNQFLQTNLPNVYAAGDCAQLRHPLPGRKSIEPLWYTGRMQGITAAHNLLGRQIAYQPRIWFNSAKFFDIEYQTYGHVPPMPLPHQTQLYWQHPNGQKCLRLVYQTQTGALQGVAALGIRLRHQVLEKWMAQQIPAETALTQFRAAIFDPEFSQPVEQALINQYLLQHPHKKLTLTPKRNLWNTIFG
ncbi:NAD(P)/FAD-dependent oxidoreductase [Sphingobacteriales bacterium UPWRP_1]|nr:FAD-dependent oxidoreductase [Sphingobacteriales bacterium TSM_CSS]PSJ75659.1 NAD(P)/FAD-dependent oxidoreductase [Sphingobacteriales bacterium UPWRP_1]